MGFTEEPASEVFIMDVIVASNGYEYRIPRVEKVPRINNEAWMSMFFLYHSVEEAEHEGGAGGATGFLLRDGGANYYAVTARHNIRAGATVIRMKTVRWTGRRPSPQITVHCKADDPTAIIPLASNQWKCSEKDDVAVAFLGRHGSPTSFPHYSMWTENLISPAVISKLDIFPGDDVYMVGRYVHNDGKSTNLPFCRSGIISQMPNKNHLIPMEEDGWEPFEQEAFLVELRSISGFSGSAVFWELPWIDVLTEVNTKSIVKETEINPKQMPIQIWILGIEIATWPDKGVSVVVPGWIVNDFIVKEFEMERKKAVEDMRKRAAERAATKPTMTYEQKPKDASGDLIEVEMDFDALDRASQVIETPDSETK